MNKKKLLENLFMGLSAYNEYQKSETLLSPSVALAAIFTRRFSSPEDFAASKYSLIFYCQKDFLELQRREVASYSKGHRGYLYTNPSPKGIILYVHGIMGCSDDQYAIPQSYFVKKGYDVLAIDLSVSGQSSGVGIDGLHQGALDVVNAVKYLQNRPDLRKLPLFLFGHSWGAYSATAALPFVKGVVAVAALSGFKDPLSEMMALPKSKTGVDLDFTKAELEQAMLERSGLSYNLSAIEGINSSPSTKVYVLHGESDDIVPTVDASIYGSLHECDKGNVLGREIPKKKHGDIFYSLPAIAAQRRALQRIGEKEGEYRGYANIPPAVLNELRRSISKRECSELDLPLFDGIDLFFQSSLGVSR